MVGLYDWILHLSEESGFKNMTALCKAAGVPRANMTELKKGRSAFLSMPSATKMAETLKVPTDYLLGISIESQIDQLIYSIAVESESISSLHGQELKDAEDDIEMMRDQLEELMFNYSLVEKVNKKSPPANGEFQEYMQLLETRQDVRKLLDAVRNLTEKQIESLTGVALTMGGG